ncbi:right-handed parallel beta-helix repeat-containing protein [Domibacillus iocasae]|uniref:Right handed beta helix domain-containing protein n=1 Tax=Domibacillus iocasae TaxID=1714016 RepID=A0A1E7DPH2_9BACI|nr:right-handed parallel beta-helix repeat-containing protein [Domibacillus iocasae]OES44987.1 hypothetical protein BA724_06905 [Domibacillus iocasae]
MKSNSNRLFKKQSAYLIILFIVILAFLFPSLSGLFVQQQEGSNENNTNTTKTWSEVDVADYGPNSDDSKDDTSSTKTTDETRPEINITDYGANADDSKDDTSSIQAAIDAAAGKNGIVLIPAGTFLINTDPETGSLNVKDNIEINMDEKTILKSIPNGLPIYRMLTIYNRENVKITGGTLIGDRYKHEGTEGEFGHGIYIGGNSSEITISNVRAQDFWGDGFFVEGNASQETYPSSITIDNVESHNNRRQGISITAGKQIVVKNSIFSGTNGTPPAAGIDLERDPPYSLPLEEVELLNNEVFNNEGYGISFIYASNSSAQKNIVKNNKKGGIYIGGGVEQGIAKNNTVDDNFISENGLGIFVNFSTQNNISNNVIEKSKKDGIVLINHVGQNRLVKNLVRDNQGNGLYIWGGLHDQSGIVVQQNKISKNSKAGIAVLNVLDATITDNDLLDNAGAGLHREEAKESTIERNKSQGNGSN